MRSIPDFARAWRVIPLVFAVMVAPGCDKDPSSPRPTNLDPVLLSAFAFPTSIGPPDSALLVLNAVDPEGQQMFYDYIADGRVRLKGAYPGDAFVLSSRSNSQVVYFGTPATSPSTITIECWARDSVGGVIRALIPLDVIP